MKLTRYKSAVWFLLAAGFFVSACTRLSAQQNPDVTVWEREYADRIIEQAEANRKRSADDFKFTNPDYVVFLPKNDPNTLGDMYNDHFQVFDSPKNDTLFVVWTQASMEGALDMHVSFARSFDRGASWEPPRVIAGYATVAEGKASGGATAAWGFPLVSKSGRIYLLYNQFVPGIVSTNRQHTGLLRGIYSDDDGVTWSQPETIPMPRTANDSVNPDILPEWVVWQKPLRLAADGKYMVGMTRYMPPELHKKRRTAVEFLRFENIDDDPAASAIKISWFAQNKEIISIGAYTEEPAPVKLPDGRLFSILRTGIGSPCWTISADGGETWSQPEKLLNRDGGEPFLHPISPCPLYDRRGNEAASGEYFAFVHNTFNFEDKNPWQNRGPLYLIAGKYHEGAKQPIWFESAPKLFVNRPNGQSFYTSCTLENGVQVLWYADQKYYLLGKKIDDSWFE